MEGLIRNFEMIGLVPGLHWLSHYLLDALGQDAAQKAQAAANAGRFFGVRALKLPPTRRSSRLRRRRRLPPHRAGRG